jgi:hypothetical protein
MGFLPPMILALGRSRRPLRAGIQMPAASRSRLVLSSLRRSLPDLPFLDSSARGLVSAITIDGRPSVMCATPVIDPLTLLRRAGAPPLTSIYFSMPRGRSVESAMTDLAGRLGVVGVVSRVAPSVVAHPATGIVPSEIRSVGPRA